MSATILEFPSKKPARATPTYRIPLYTDLEIDTVIICLNVFSTDDIKYNYDNVNRADPYNVIKCLYDATTTEVFTESVINQAKLIIENIETIP